MSTGTKRHISIHVNVKIAISLYYVATKKFFQATTSTLKINLKLLPITGYQMFA